MESNSLYDLTKSYGSISMIGMAKNAGKTVALNALLAELFAAKKTVAITSIGRDGEKSDVVTKTAKPDIYVVKGTLIATSSDLLSKCDITKEILRTTGVNTPLGEVVILRALSDGFVEIGGASIGSQIIDVVASFKELGAEKIIVDGALSRKTQASPSITDCTVLCTGSSLDVDMEKVIENTAFVCKMFKLPRVEDSRVVDLINNITQDVKTVFIYSDLRYEFVDIDDITPRGQTPAYIFINGAVLDSYMLKLITADMKLRDTQILVRDSCKVFISESTYEKLLIRESNVWVLEAINLVALTINPISPYGYEFDKKIFMESMKSKTDLPVFNVKEEV